MTTPAESGPEPVLLTILIPVYNEIQTLETVVTRALAADTLGRTREIIMETGYKVIRRTLLDRLELREERFGIEPEVTMKLARLRPRPHLVEVPIHYASRGYAAGKKLTPVDGLRALYCLVRYRLSG